MNLSDDTFKRFFNLSNQLLSIASLEGEFILVNESFSQVLGYGLDELIGVPFLTFIHEQDVQKTLDAMAQLERGEPVTVFSIRYRHSQGHYVRLAWKASLDPDFRVVHAIASDITEAELAQNRLQQIENALYNETIFVKTNHKGVITTVNDEFCEISGYRREELIGNTHAMINSGVHPKAFFTDMWRTIAKGSVWSGVIQNKRKDGRYYYVQSVLIPIMGEHGKPIEYIGIRQDITQSIFDHQDYLKTLGILNETSEIAKVGGWELDIATQELEWTDETFKILEVKKEADRKPNLPQGLSLFTDEYKDIVDAAVGRAIEHGEPYNLEVKAKTAKGNEVWVYTNGKANYSHGKIVSLSGTIQDISERKAAELKYEEQRRKSIQNSKLVALGELSASVAHEINNPLGIISGYAELMAESTDLPERFKEKVAIIDKSCDRISYIVKSLKKFSRSDEIKEKSTVPLAEIINEAITLAFPRLKRMDIALRISALPNAAINCNEIEIEQVFLNLLNNSIDALENQSEKWIEMSMKVMSEKIEVRFSDSGIGIEKQNRLKIFEPFYTTKVEGAGTGLGLAITKGIIDEHGGSIQLDADSDTTVFVIRFPRVQ